MSKTLAWTDSNYDQKLSPSDPVWAELKVWQDLNQNGSRDACEAKTLTALNITELNYAMGTFTQVNQATGATQVKQLSSPDLEADKDGTRVTVVPEGILVQASQDGHLSLLVSRVDDRTALEVNRDGITGFEDIETIVNSRDLLANDTLGGFAGSNLSVTSVSNFKHGTGYLDANETTNHYKNRSCLRTYSLGYRSKTHLKTGKNCEKRACRRAKNLKGVKKEASLGIKHSQSHLFMCANSYEINSKLNLTRDCK